MSDYDRDPREAPSQFLRLKAKDDSVVIRLASAPYREPKIWKVGELKPMTDENVAQLTKQQWAAIMGNPDYNVTETFSWKVLDRADGKPKIFTSTPGVYKKVKSYATMEAWGDPQSYDMQITRTEEPGVGYYDVMALPEKTKLNDKEVSEIESLDMSKLLPNARLSSEPQLDDLDDEFTAPQKPKAVAANEGPDEPLGMDETDDINLDEIPFN